MSPHACPPRTHLSLRCLRHTASALGLLVFGCAHEGDAFTPSEEPAQQATVAAGGTPLDGGVAPPYTVSVTANGTGCPQGTWHASISPDPSTVLVTFSKFEAAVSGNTRIQVADCLLSVRFRSDVPSTYAVTSWLLQGYAFLQAGVRASHETRAYAAGSPAMLPSQRVDLVGPLDRAYRLEETVPDEDLVFLPCGLDRQLQISTRLLAQKNGNGAGEGYVTLSALAGDAVGKVQVGLKWRACADRPRDAGQTTPTIAGGLDAGML